MLKTKIALLAVCVALFIATVCGNQRAGMNIKSTAKPLSLQPGAPAPQISPKTVRVRLTEVETNADIVDWPSPGSEIIIKAGATSLNQKTDENGLVVFDAVPCGQQIVITRKGADGEEDAVFRRRLICTGRQVDFGILERAFGGKYTLRQRKLQRMGYDATNNVWRDADGKRISMKTFNRIMSQRH